MPKLNIGNSENFQPVQNDFLFGDETGSSFLSGVRSSISMEVHVQTVTTGVGLFYKS